MSQVSPGWYPDPSGRFVQRYHDGTHWTEHVADAHGNRATDVPEAQARPASYQPEGYGTQGADRGDDWQAAGGRDRGQAADAAGVWSGTDGGGAPGGARWPAQDWPGDRAGDQGWSRSHAGEHAGTQGWRDARAGGSADDERWPVAQASDGGWPAAQTGGQPGAQQWATTQAPGTTGDPAWPPASPRPSAGTSAAHGYDAGQRYGPQRRYGPQPAYGQPGDAYGGPPAVSAGGFTPTIGLIVAVVGGLLVLLSLFGLDFLEFSVPGFSETISLADVAGDFSDDAPFAIDTYASFGRFLAVVVIVGVVLAVLRVIPVFREGPAGPIIVAAVCAAFALWQVFAMLSSAEEGVDVSPTFGAILGLLGYVGLAAGPFLRQPLGPVAAER